MLDDGVHTLACFHKDCNKNVIRMKIKIKMKIIIIIIMIMTMTMIMTMPMTLSSVDIEVIGTVFIIIFFYEKILSI